MSKDELDIDDNYEMDDFDDFLMDGEEPKREPPSNAREAVSYAISDTASGIKEGFSKANLTQNLKSLTTNLAPSALDGEMKQIKGIKDVLDKELGSVLEENKDKIANISGFVMSKTKEGGIFHKLAKSVNDRMVGDSSEAEEAVESIAQRVVSSELENAMAELKANKLDTVKKFTQQEALNRIYTTMLKTEAFNRTITSTYYRKSLEYQFIQLTTAKKIYEVNRGGFSKIENALSYVVKNTSLPDIVKLKSIEAVEAQARNRMVNSGLDKLFGDNGWVTRIISKVKSKKEDINQGLSSLDEGVDTYRSVEDMNDLMAEMGGGSKTKMMASMAPSAAMGILGKYLSNIFSKTEKGSRFIDFTKDMMSNPSEMLKNTARSLDGKTSSNKYVNFIKGKLTGGISNLADFLDDGGGKQNMTIATKDLYEAATIDRKTLVTQNEVIPSLLSKILKEVYLIRTGKNEGDVDELKFDYNSRSFSTASKMATKLSGKIGDVIQSSGAAADITTMSNFILSKSGVEYDEQKAGKVRSGLTSFLQSGKSFKPSQLDDDFYKHFDKDTAELVRTGMEAINDSKNASRGKERSKLRDSFAQARGKIPTIDKLIEAHIDAGNTDILLKNNIITYDEKLGRYRANDKAYDKIVLDNIAMYKGSGYQYDLSEKKSGFDIAKEYMGKGVQFRDNVLTNLDNSPFSVRTNSNIPMSGTMFSTNKSGTNSIPEAMATEAARRAIKAGVKINNNPLFQQAKNYTKSNIDSMTNKFKSTGIYQDLDAMYKRNKNLFTKEGLKSYIQENGKEYRDNILTNLDNRHMLNPYNTPMAGSMFTLNKSGTNSKMENLATKTAREAMNLKIKLGDKNTYVNLKNDAIDRATNLYNEFSESETGKTIKKKATELRKAVLDSKIYKTVDKELSELNIKLNRNIIFKDGETKSIDMLKTVQSISSTIDKKASESYVEFKYRVKEEYLKKALDVGLINGNQYMDGMYAVMVGRADEAKSENKTISGRFKSTGTFIKDKLTNRFKDTTVEKELTGFKDTVIDTLKSVKESDRYKSLQKLVDDKLKELDMEGIKNLKPKHILEITNLLVTSKDASTVKPNLISYLYTNNLISENMLKEHMVELESDSKSVTLDKEGKPTMMSKLSGMFSAVRDIELLKRLKGNREETAELKREAETIEEAIEKKEDKRVETILTKVIDKLGLSKDKKAEHDADDDGLRDGSWMSKIKKGRATVRSKEPSEDISKKTSDDKKSPLWTIAKLLLMGIPILISKITGMFTGIDGVWQMVKKFPTYIGEALDGLAGKLLDGVKWLGGGLIDLGSTVVSGLGGFLDKVWTSVIDIGKSIGGHISNLTSTITTKLADLGKSIATAVVDGVKGGVSKIKNVFGFGDETPDVDIDKDKKLDTDNKDKPKDTDDNDNKDKDSKVEDTKDKPKDTDSGDKSKDTKVETDTKAPDLDKVNKTKSKWWEKAFSKAKDIGKSVIKNPLTKKIPIIGAGVGAVYAGSQLVNGDISGGVTSILSGLAGSIPIVGIGLSAGIDYLGAKYNEWNPDINKELYSNQNFSNIPMDALDQITLNHIRKHETGSAEGKYDMAGDIGDGAGISFGAYQLTEKSGNLKEYLKRLVAITNDPVGQEYLNKFNGVWYDGIKSGLIKYLKATGDTPAGRHVQDTMYKEIFLDPAKKLAASYGITNPASISQLIDHSVNAGLGGAKRMLNYTNGDYSPESIARARKADYNRLIEINNALDKYRKSWFGRVDGNAKMFSIEANKITNPSEVTDTVGALNQMQPPVVNPTNQSVVNPVLQDASKLAGVVPTAITTNTTTPINPNNVTNPLAGIGLTNMNGASQPISTPNINTGALEALISKSNQALLGIQANTTNMVSGTTLIVTAIKELKDAMIGKGVVNNKTTTNNSTIKVPMGEGVNITKPKY